MKYSLITAALAGMILLQSPLFAQDRHFAWTYETTTLPKGSIDIEPWVTYSTGRDNFYARYETRMEFEFGLTDRLQTALYLNSKSSAEATTDTAGNITGLLKKSSFSLSNEWKLNLLNPSVHPVGFGLYGEYTLYPHEIELEYKLLFDKRSDKHILAFNHVGEYEIEYAFDNSGGTGKIEQEKELVFIHDLAYMFLFKPYFGLGAEVKNHTEIVEGETEHSTLSGGPTLFYSSNTGKGAGYFIILSLMPQWSNLAGDEKPLDLKGHEKYEARALLGITF